MIAMIAERLLPSSKLAHTRHWHSTTLAEELDVAYATEDHLYEAMDWLLKRQGAIEKRLAQRHLHEGAFVLYDVTSSYYQGKTCPSCSVRPRSRRQDRLLDHCLWHVGPMPTGRSAVAVHVYLGNTADSKTVPDQFETSLKQYREHAWCCWRDRGMLTQTQIDMLKKHPGLGWISALRAAKRNLPPDGQGPSDQEEFGSRTPDAEISLDFLANDEGLLQRAVGRAHAGTSSQELLAATQAELEALAASITRQTGQPEKAADIGVRVGKIINHYKMTKHFTLTIRDGYLGWARNEVAIQKEELLDGIYVIRTSEPA